MAQERPARSGMPVSFVPAWRDTRPLRGRGARMESSKPLALQRRTAKQEHLKKGPPADGNNPAVTGPTTGKPRGEGRRENSAAGQGALAELDQAGADRVVMEARLAAISVQDGDGHLQDLALSIRQAGLGQGEANRLLIRAWETAVQGALEDGLLSLDEENALARYADHFSLTQQNLDQNGVHTSLVQAAVIRDVTQGIIPKRQRVNGAVPFNLMKSEQLVWVIQGVDYLETVVRRERRGSSQGLSIRVARGLYHRPSTFRSQPIEWEETVHAGTGTLGLTTKHIYVAGSRKRFRVRYDRIVAFEPYSDGFGIMRDAQTAKPQTFRTGDRWFAYNPAANLAPEMSHQLYSARNVLPIAFLDRTAGPASG